MKAFILSLLLISVAAVGADTIINPGTGQSAFFKDNLGNLYPLSISYQTDGAGHLKLINSSNPVDDTIITPPNSGKMYLQGANSKLYPAIVLYSTDGNGNLIPIPAGGGGGGVSAVTASSPLASSGGSTPNITAQVATTSQNGYLSSTDWNIFNGKQAAGSYLTALTGDITATGPGSASATLANSVNVVYVDFISGNDSTGTGTAIRPWKTLQKAYNSITPSINVPYTIHLSGGNNDTDTAITAKPNVSIFADYSIQISPSFTISGGTTNDGATFTNINFVGAFNWTRNDSTQIGATFNNCQFFAGPTVKQTGAGVASVFGLDSTFVNSEFQLSHGGFGVFPGTSFLGTTKFDDPGTGGTYYQMIGGYNDGAMTISGPVDPVYFGGFVQDTTFGASLTFVTTGNGTPTVESDSAGLTATYTGTPTVTLLSHAQYDSYTPTTSGNWSPVPTEVHGALDQLAANAKTLSPSGTVCGWYDTGASSLIVACQTHNPNVDCPAGYSQKTTTGAKFCAAN